MQISVSYDQPKEGSGSGPLTIGWLLQTGKGGVIFEPPKRVHSVEMSREHAKSASRCPAIINMESRYFQIDSPYDLHLRFERSKDGKPGLKNMAGKKSAVRGNKLQQMLSITAETEWRHPDRPTIQLALPYIFIADDPVYISQVAPFMHYQKNPWPGTLFGGRFPISIWPRPLIWAFEWCDTSKDLILSRGDPLFYCLFETLPQDRAVKMVEAEKTPELQEYLDQISGAVNFVNQTFSLFKSAERIRPEKLVTPKKR